MGIIEKTTEDIAKKSAENKVLEPNPILPAFSNAIRLVYDEVRVRYGVATRDIDPGTVLLEEKPVAAILKHQHSMTYCDHCLSKLSSLPVPCQSCNDVRY